MEETKILVLAERSDAAQTALQKASILARHLGAQVELFACDSEHAWAVARRATDPVAERIIETCLGASLRYLEALRGSIGASDLCIGVSAACADSQADGLAACVLQLGPQVVVYGFAKSVDRDGKRASHPELFQLLRKSCVPLLLTHGQPWAPRPKICIAADFGEPGLHTRARLVQFAQRLSSSCAGQAFEAPGAEVGRPLMLAQYVEHAGADILLVAGPQDVAWPMAQSTELEILLAAVDSDVLVVPRSPLSARVPPAFVAFRTNTAHGQREKS